MKSKFYALILAGGAGTRFWPLSTDKHPKQFMDVLGLGKPLLRITYERIKPLFLNENIFVITSKKYKHLVEEILPEISKENILLEEARKNTAPGVAYGAFKIHKKNPDSIMLVIPSDHIIKKEKVFRKAISSCFQVAEQEECIITIGIRPTRPDTGYGYIQFLPDSNVYADERIFKVKTFTEKPDAAMAKFFIDSGDFLWNSGIFIWKTSYILELLSQFEPELYQTFHDAARYLDTPNEQKAFDDAFIRCKNISIDYAVLEKAPKVLVRSSIIGWSDIGTWGSIYEHINPDENRNAVVGKNIMLYESSGNMIHVPDNKLVVLHGIHDCIIVEKDNMLLICKKEDEQHIRSMVNDIKIKKGDKYV
ncbi:MAG: sugar phosphate nucleotidyltransferase [Bacteroidia bacterium]|nr:sugar phosphate nucleotidyltransferase [Bacteroidia bacterium]